ncbi:MAG: hypothetical protein ABIZ36_06120 [Gemmatimonadaceae bacterium]
MKNRTRLLSLVAIVTVAGCTAKETPNPADSTAMAGAPAATAAAPNVVNITASEYKFEAPAEVPAGMTTFTLTDGGKEIHHAQLIKLDSGKTMDDMMAGMKATKPGTPPPGWVIAAGGANAVAPGNSASLTLNLEPGNYVLACFIPDAKGVPHFMHGMVKTLKVTPNAAANTTPPTSDITLTLSDYKFDFSSPLTAGQHTLKIQTAPGQPHEFTLFQLAPGKTAADVVKFVEGGDVGTPPGKPIGGVVALAPGRDVFYTVDLKPGDYAAICFLDDGKDGKPHYTHGMSQTIKIS